MNPQTANRVLWIALAFLPISTQGASNYIRKAANDSVIIFVHGVTGDGVKTWTSEKTRNYWPRLIAEDPVFSQENVFVYEYPSASVTGSFNINELAEDLRLTIADEVAKHRRVIFIAHSMGGLVVRQYLIKYRDIADKVAFTYFYATPTTGSPMANLVAMFTKNPQFGNLRPMNVDQYLGNLQRDWLAAPSLTRISAFCAYETRDTHGFRIVGQDSATNLCNKRLDAIDANHIDIVKPDDRSDQRYRAFRSAYTEVIGAPDSGATIGLRVDIQNVQQAIPLQAKQPRTVQGESVFCDSMRLSLILARTGRSSAPIVVNSIAVKASPFNLDQLQAGTSCQVDQAGALPHGIIEKNMFFVSLTERANSVRWIKDGSNSSVVRTENILSSPTSSRGIVLKPNEEPVSLDFYVRSTIKSPQVLTFSVNFDEGGEKTLSTKQVVVWR